MKVQDMAGERAADRSVLIVSGSDARKFLQDTITNDIAKADAGLAYAAILSPQGKYLFDFLITNLGHIGLGEGYLLDCDQAQAAALLSRLNMYKLRADVTLTQSELSVWCGINPTTNARALMDPRHADLGWRAYSDGQDEAPQSIDWDDIYVRNCIPRSTIELISGETYILEAGFERLNGVDFRKGCYVGQEVTARMKHKTELRKGFVTVAIDGAAPIGSDILSNSKPIGRLFSQSNGLAIAYLRFDRVTGDMQAENATISLRETHAN